MEEQRPSDVVSVGIAINNQIHLHKINQREPLETVLETLHRQLGLPGDKKYALQFDKRNAFVTESNRSEIKNGDVCHLVYSQEVLAKTILERLHDERWVLRKLLDFVQDESLLCELEKQDGVAMIVTLLQEETLPSEVQELAFQVVAELFMQDKVSVEWLKGRLLRRVFSQVSGESLSTGTTVAACLRICLALYLQGQTDGLQQVSLEQLSFHMDSTSLRVQEAALALFNAICDKEGSPDRKLLLKVRDQLSVAVKELPALLPEFQLQLKHFQARLMARLVKKFESPARLDDPQVQRRLSDLSQQDEKKRRRDTFTETTMKLLCEFVAPPPEEVQPTLLLLDCLTHSIRHDVQHVSASLIEQQPFLRLCNQLIKIQIDALGLLTDEVPLHPVLFYDRAFEEMFCVCIRTLNKTCKEMRAKGDDLPKILTVHAKKIQLSLAKRPVDLAAYEKALCWVSYNEVWEDWHEEERLRQEQEFRTKQSFIELRAQLQPHYEQLIKMQRLRVMTEGTRFRKFVLKTQHLRSGGSKDRYWTVTYLPKSKAFEFKDAEEKFNDFTVDILQIKNVLFGDNCPHVKSRGHKGCTAESALSINLTTSDPEFLNLGALTLKERDFWVDGIRMLLGQNMSSDSYTKELQDLLDMHMKLHFIGLEDIIFPDGPPPKVPDIFDGLGAEDPLSPFF